MASKPKIATVVPPSYVEFEPYCEWKKEDRAETLVLHLPDFKKDQLKVQVNNLGVLKVSGERPTNEDGTKQSRFMKETKLPQGCDVNGIQAKFSGGSLYVIMPRKPTPQDQVQPQPQPQPQPLPQKLKEVVSAKTGTSGCDEPKRDHMFGLGDTLRRLKDQNKVNVKLGVAVAAIVVIGAYVGYKYGSRSSPPSNVEK